MKDEEIKGAYAFGMSFYIFFKMRMKAKTFLVANDLQLKRLFHVILLSFSS